MLNKHNIMCKIPYLPKQDCRLRKEYISTMGELNDIFVKICFKICSKYL